MTLPSFSSEERTAALGKSLRVRRVRAQFKADIRSQTLGAAEALDMAVSDDVLGKIKVFDFLRCLPGIGERRATNLMNELGISVSRRLQGLGTRQKRALVERLKH